MSTNDVFHHLIRLTGIYKDKEYILSVFESSGWDISKSKIKAWDTKTGIKSPGYREMPREVLDDFINELYKRGPQPNE